MDFIDKRVRSVRIILAALLLGYSAGSLLLRDEKLVAALHPGENNASDDEETANEGKAAGRKPRRKAQSSASS